MIKTVNVPAFNSRWRIGTLLRDTITKDLYRVTSPTKLVDNEGRRVQEVVLVQHLPPDEVALQRLLLIMDDIFVNGYHTPPPIQDLGTSWTFHYANIRVVIDVLIYDNGTSTIWKQNADLAEEARQLIATKPTLTRYPAVYIYT